MNITKRPTNSIIICILLLAGIIITMPAVTAPIWYGSGDDAGLVGRWNNERFIYSKIME